MNRKWLFVGLLFAVTAAGAQQSTPHNMARQDIIDGSKNPELIPDSTAWRLWMLSVTAKDPKHPELDQVRQDAFLKAAGFEIADLPAMRKILSDFRRTYDAMLAAHNQAEAANQHPSLPSLKTMRDSLVETAQASMLTVKTETATRVKTFVTGEKKQMRIPRMEVMQ